ncbi:MAG: sugar phosphate isomerase/epimerase [Lachnospiraceae bacterium]|nr:sugar phosphate isomerase/epimerase [Lachnospiraceae bacterium]
MDMVCGLSGMVSVRNPVQGISDISEAGFESVLLDIGMCCSPWEIEALGRRRSESKAENPLEISSYPEEMLRRADPIRNQCVKRHISMPAAYAPYLKRDSQRGDLNDLLFLLAKESLRIGKKAGCKDLIVRPWFAGIAKEDLWHCNKEYYLRLAAFAKESGIRILLVNLCRDLNGHLVRGIVSEGEEAALWVDRLNEEVGEERFGFCMDAGACNLCGQNMQEFVLALGKRLKAVILRDCDGHKETSMLPFICSDSGQAYTDWLDLIRGLRKIGFDESLILDFSDTARAFSPLLRPQFIRFAKAVAEYFKWQVEMESFLKKYPGRVLFGAGNMCRNYMKCYGEAYPPLFTCDNNQALWGQEFCGLEVKPPESLKDLPEDCAVFICNVYYREIEAQLRDMGIRNPIEFFNDEYLPAYHFEPLKGDR